MKKYNTLYYLLFVLLITGAFASMAQNAYGFVILGSVSFSFSILFLYQFIERLFIKNFRAGIVEDLVELSSLTILSSILGLRVFYIHFPFVEILFGLAGIALITLYGLKLLKNVSVLKSGNKMLMWLIVSFYVGIILYIGSMIAAAFSPTLSEPIGQLAFGLILIFIIAGIVRGEHYLDGNKVSVFTYSLRLRDKSVLLMSLFLVFTGYMGLTKIGAIPTMYSNEFPQAYFQLVTAAEQGKEKADEGVFQHEKFKQQYDAFIENNKSRPPIE